ncbi:MAG TPA: hypothetical protein PKY77_20870 [Phycisphaerae bacterium]|nr:hypothetical protein [Phycisphaerae bacterium]
MGKIKGADKVEKALGSLELSKFRIVRQLCFEEKDTDGRVVQCVHLVLETEDTNPRVRAQFDFNGVSGLQVNKFGGGETRIVGFDIVDISDRHWQHLNWEVIDYEDGCLRFHCDTAQVTALEVLQEPSP